MPLTVSSVCQGKLLEVLRQFGIVEKEGKWFQSYLANRQQHVQITHFDCEGLYLKYVVPDGAGRAILYADDAKIVTGPNKETVELCSFVNQYSFFLFLSGKNWLVSTLKTKCLFFHSRKTSLN